MVMWNRREEMRLGDLQKGLSQYSATLLVPGGSLCEILHTD